MGIHDSLHLLARNVLYKSSRWYHEIRAVVTIDVRKSFDTVSHWAVIQEATHLAITGSAVNYIKKFIKHRYYVVKIADDLSDRRLNQTGVPQGSVLFRTL